MNVNVYQCSIKVIRVLVICRFCPHDIFIHVNKKNESTDYINIKTLNYKVDLKSILFEKTFRNFLFGMKNNTLSIPFLSF